MSKSITRVEKAEHVKAFKLYLEMGGISPEFLSAFAKQTGKTEKTAYRWQADFNWKERAKKPIVEAVEKLEAEQQINAEELISGLLDLCKTRMDWVKSETESIKAIFATAYEKIQAGELKVESISDLTELIRAQSRIFRDEQAYMRLILMIVGKPEQIMEDRMEVTKTFYGYIDDVRIWSIVKTERQILNGMIVGRISGDEPGIIAYWDFEREADDQDILYDKSGNGHDGDIVGAVWEDEDPPPSMPQ